MTTQMTRRGFLATGAATGGLLALSSGPLWAAPKRGGRLRLGLSGANTSDSWDGRTQTDTFMLVAGHGCVFDCLTEINAKGELQGELAESWESSEDSKTWTFNLRSGVTFHNGKAFGADDVIESLKLHVEEGSKSAAAPIVQNIADMKKLSDQQIQFTLSGGNADFPYLLADYHLQIYPAGQIGEAIAQGIGTGLYKVESFDPGVRFVGKRVDSHYKGDAAGFFDEVEIIAINDANARQTALMTGQVDAITNVDVQTEALIKANPNVDIFEVTGNAHYTLPMHANVAPFDDLNVRRALKHAINRQEMVDKILRGHGAIGNDHPIGPANRYYAGDLPQNDFDLDKAKFYLKEAGLSELNIDLSTSEAAFGGAPDAAQLFQASARSVGININLIQEPSDGYWSNVWLKKPFCMAQWSGRSTEDLMFSTAYETGVSWNDTFWENERFQSLLLEARAVRDQDKRAEMYREMQAIMSTDGATIVPMYNNFVDAASTKLANSGSIGNNFRMDGGRFVERWWFA